MIPAIEYQKASSIDEAITLISDSGDVKLLAGGAQPYSCYETRIKQPG